MDNKFIQDALAGEIEWFDPHGDYTEEDMKRGIEHSIEVSKHLRPLVQPVEELAELTKSHLDLIQAISKHERDLEDFDNYVNLHEEIGDALWAIAYIIERYNLSIKMIKDICRLKDQYEIYGKK